MRNNKRLAPAIKAEWISHIPEQAGEGMAVADLEGRIIFANKAWAQMHGYRVSEIIGKKLRIFHNAKQLREDVIPFNQRVKRFGKWSGMVGHIRRGGIPFITEMTTTVLRDNHRRPVGFIGFAKDISDRLRAEQTQRALERVLDMVARVNQAVSRASDEKTLLQEVCDIVVNTGGYVMAWVGAVLPEGRGRIKPLASSGAEHGYLRSVSIDRRGPLGGGPTGRALRSGRPWICHNIPADPSYRPWRRQALERGYASSAAFPLIFGDEALGVLNVYSERTDAFGHREVVLLKEMAGAISHGIVSLRQRLVNQLFFEALPDLFLRLDRNGTILEHRGRPSPILLGRSDRLVGRKLSAIFPKKVTATMAQALSRTFNSHRVELVEFSVESAKSVGHFESRLLPLGQDQVAVLIRDITRRRAVEEELQRSQQQYRTLAGISPVGIFQTKPNGYTTYVNPQWCRIAGLSASQAMGNGWLKAVHPEDRRRIQAGWRRAIGGRSPSSTLYRFLHRDGQVRWVIGQAKPEVNHQGRIVGYVGTITDITDLKTAEESLRSFADFNQSIISRSPIGIAIRDRSGRLISYNKAWERLWALPRQMIEEMKQSMTPDLLRKIYWYVPEHLPQIIKIFQNGGSYFIPDIHFPKRRPGQAEWINQYFYSIPDARGRVDKIVVMVEDITPRKQAELEASMLAEAMRSTSECINITDLEDNILFVNESFCRTYGYRPEELIGRNISLVIPPGPDHDEIEAVRRSTLEGGCQVELDNIRKDGTRFPVQLSTSVVRDGSGRPRYFIGVTRDISRRRASEAALRESESRYRLLVQHAPAGIFEFDYVRSRIVDVNDVMCQYTGYPREEIIAMDPLELLDGPSQKLQMERLAKARSGQAIPEETEYRIRCKDGRYLWCIFRSNFIFENGRLVKATTIVHDISERRMAEERLAESEAKYRQIFEGIAEGIYRSTPEGRVLMANPALVRLLGYGSLEELQGIDISREGYVNPDDRIRFQRSIESQGYVKDFVTTWRRRDGTELIVNENARAFKDQAGRIVFYEGTVEDITERTRAALALLDEKNKLSRLFDVSLMVAGSGTVEEMMDRTIEGLNGLGLFRRLLMVVEREKGGGTWLSHRGLSRQDQEMLRDHPPQPPGRLKDLMDSRYRICHSYYLPDCLSSAASPISLMPSPEAPAVEWKSGDILAVPLVAKGSIIGYLIGLDPTDGRVPTVEAVRLLELYANQAATAIVNLRLYDDLEASYYDTLKAFVAAMEAKDPYTKGHSEKVQAYSLRLAQHLGLASDRLRIIDYSSLLHDIGKLGVREFILNKPGALSAEEYQEVKQHPSLGSQMVSGIGILTSSAPIIQAHHEFFDGSGYPEGRSGQEIPLEARIISVADAYEAMTSDRPYRRAYSHQEAIGRLREAARRQFDPELVEAFVGMLQTDAGGDHR